MGINSFIRRTEVREKFRNEFKKPNVSRMKEFLAPPITNKPQKLGKAFDYLLRFYLKCLNPQSEEEKWTAENMVEQFNEILESYNSNPNMQMINQRLHTIIKEAREIYTNFLRTSDLEVSDELIDSALYLARIDQMGYINPEAKIPNIFSVSEDDKKDLRNLISAVEPEFFL